MQTRLPVFSLLRSALKEHCLPMLSREYKENPPDIDSKLYTLGYYLTLSQELLQSDELTLDVLDRAARHLVDAEVFEAAYGWWQCQDLRRARQELLLYVDELRAVLDR